MLPDPGSAAFCRRRIDRFLLLTRTSDYRHVRPRRILVLWALLSEYREARRTWPALATEVRPALMAAGLGRVVVEP